MKNTEAECLFCFGPKGNCEYPLLCDLLESHPRWWRRGGNRSWNGTCLIAENTLFFTIDELHDITLEMAKRLNDEICDGEPDDISDEDLLRKFTCPIWPFKCVNYLHKVFDYQEEGAGLDNCSETRRVIIDSYMTILDHRKLGEITPEILELSELYKRKTNEQLADHLIHCSVDDAVLGKKDGDNEGMFCGETGMVCQRDDCSFSDGIIDERYAQMQSFCHSITQKHNSSRVIIKNPWPKFQYKSRD